MAQRSTGRRRTSRRSHRSRRGRWSMRLLLGFGALALGGALWLLWPLWELTGQFSAYQSKQPSRLYSRAPELRSGAIGSVEALAASVEEVGYRQVGPEDPLRPGDFSRTSSAMAVYLRSFPSAGGWSEPRRLLVRFAGRRIGSLEMSEGPVRSVSLEPQVVASYYGPNRQERRPVLVSELPPELIQAVLAAEDAGFFEHPGLSPSAIVRAAWANLRAGGVLQGGSTLTQQLVKNLFLTHERTLGRKLREMVLAVLVELRWDKREILQAYLNEIYLGSSGSVSLVGVGAAARAYFGKDASRLQLAEAATLAGIIPAPARYSPLRHPEKALTRRNAVLERLAALGWQDAEQIHEATRLPLGVEPRAVGERRAPYFAELVQREARQRYGLAALSDRGLHLLSTLDWADQERAEEAVSWGLKRLEDGWERGRRGAEPLQAALVSLDPTSGFVRAYVGGRDYRQSQYDRAGLARRQAGSAFKPVVYAAAFESGEVLPSSLLRDAPFTLAMAGRSWSPENADGEYRGLVTARQALEQSLNVPTARLALRQGLLAEVVELGRRLGIGSSLRPLPALALGAAEVTPLELATVYATIAAGGRRPPVHALVAVLGPRGEPIEGKDPGEPERVLSPEAAYMVTSILQGVLDRGTGRGVRQQGLRDVLAGKTGTTNDRRDSWFAGYAPNRATAVWVGYDDNRPTRLGGARAALPIWTRFTYAARPAGGYPIPVQPAGLTTAVIDPATGELATDRCPQAIAELFPIQLVPRRVCRLHGGRHGRPIEEPEGIEAPGLRHRGRWWRRLLRRRDG